MRAVTLNTIQNRKSFKCLWTVYSIIFKIENHSNACKIPNTHVWKLKLNIIFSVQLKYESTIFCLKCFKTNNKKSSDLSNFLFSTFICTSVCGLTPRWDWEHPPPLFPSFFLSFFLSRTSRLNLDWQMTLRFSPLGSLNKFKIFVNL